ncbi:MAG: phenylalanine--tRNA ligase subunit alpha [Bacteroidales bacterium]
MNELINKYFEEIKSFHPTTISDLEDFRLRFLSKKGIIAELFDQFRQLPKEAKKDTGRLLNDLKNAAVSRYEQFQILLKPAASSSSKISDLSLPGYNVSVASRHPISIVRKEISEIFSRLGFTIADGPEIEDDWHVFSALNFPPEHPARDMQDTFFLEQNTDILLRTHTSSVQVRVMETTQPPIRMIMPGRVFRNEAISARAHCIFHQVEGLYIDKNVSFADLKQTLLYFAREMFGQKTKVRLRPSFFPFTEPSAEFDVSCTICQGKGCNICKYTGWLEILGCGMVDPNVLSFNEIDPSIYSGYAFGMGIERIAQLTFQVRDLRLYFENDIRFLHQFSPHLHFMY